MVARASSLCNARRSARSPRPASLLVTTNHTGLFHSLLLTVLLTTHSLLLMCASPGRGATAHRVARVAGRAAGGVASKRAGQAGAGRRPRHDRANRLRVLNGAEAERWRRRVPLDRPSARTGADQVQAQAAAPCRGGSAGVRSGRCFEPCHSAATDRAAAAAVEAGGTRRHPPIRTPRPLRPNPLTRRVSSPPLYIYPAREGGPRRRVERG